MKINTAHRKLSAYKGISNKASTFIGRNKFNINMTVMLLPGIVFSDFFLSAYGRIDCSI